MRRATLKTEIVTSPGLKSAKKSKKIRFQANSPKSSLKKKRFKEDEVEEEVKEVIQYKLTTTRYQGMMDEEYNSEDLEIMKSNGKRSLY